MASTLRRSVWPLVVMLGLLYLAYDAGSQQQSLASSGLAQGLLRVQYIPDPNDIVNLAQGTPYTVPEGKLLIITDWTTMAVSTIHPCCSLTIVPQINVDGVTVWAGGYAFGSSTNGSSASSGSETLEGSLRSGIKVEAGQTVTLLSNPGSDPPGYIGAVIFAAGYLAKAD